MEEGEIKKVDGKSVKLFCGERIWLDNVSCNKRVEFMVKKHGTSSHDAKVSLLEGNICNCRIEPLPVSANPNSLTRNSYAPRETNARFLKTESNHVTQRKTHSIEIIETELGLSGQDGGPKAPGYLLFITKSIATENFGHSN